MKLSIIGMSGSGKSYWSKKLQEEKGFKRFCCDDIIEQKLSHELKKFGYSGLHDVGKWMGQPFDPQYVKRSKNIYILRTKQRMKYLELLNTKKILLLIRLVVLFIWKIVFYRNYRN